MIQCHAGPKTWPNSFSKSEKCGCHFSSYRADLPCKFWLFASKAHFNGLNGGKWYPCGGKKPTTWQSSQRHRFAQAEYFRRALAFYIAILSYPLPLVLHLHFILQYCHIHLHVVCTCMSYGALACHMHLLHVFCADLRLETFCQSVVRQGLRLGNRAEPGFISSSCRVSQKIAYGTLRARLGN